MTRARVLAGVVATLVMVLAACSGADEDAPADGRVMTPQALSGDEMEEPADEVALDDAAVEDAPAPAADPGAGEGTGFAGGGDDGAAPLPELVTARTGERVIKDGTMTIEVAEGGFLQAHRRVIETALDLGGHLTDSNSRSTDDGGTAGSVTVRVPVERYEELLTRVGQVGTLRAQNVSSRDVTAEFTDLESRLRHLRAQEAFYLGLLEDAEDVRDAIAVKQQLDGIQSQIEQAQGRLNVLQDRTSYSTLTVEIIEPGAGPLTSLVDDRPMLGQYWQTARDGFVTVVGWLLVAGVSLSPLVVPLLLLAVAWRLSRRRPAVPATVAADGD